MQMDKKKLQKLKKISVMASGEYAFEDQVFKEAEIVTEFFLARAKIYQTNGWVNKDARS